MGSIDVFYMLDGRTVQLQSDRCRWYHIGDPCHLVDGVYEGIDASFDTAHIIVIYQGVVHDVEHKDNVIIPCDDLPYFGYWD
jgi:hypothetical protein